MAPNWWCRMAKRARRRPLRGAGGATRKIDKAAPADVIAIGKLGARQARPVPERRRCAQAAAVEISPPRRRLRPRHRGQARNDDVRLAAALAKAGRGGTALAIEARRRPHDWC